MPEYKANTACLAHVPELVNNLQPEDIREIIEGIGINPVLSISMGIVADDTIVFTAPDGKAAGVAGVDASGCIWMHCTSKTKQYPITFVKQAKQWINDLPHPILYNYADIRNITHLKLLKHLGFRFLRVVPYGPRNLYFVEFVRLWSCQSLQG